MLRISNEVPPEVLPYRKIYITRFLKSLSDSSPFILLTFILFLLGFRLLAVIIALVFVSGIRFSTPRYWIAHYVTSFLIILPFTIQASSTSAIIAVLKNSHTASILRINLMASACPGTERTFFTLEHPRYHEFLNLSLCLYR